MNKISRYLLLILFLFLVFPQVANSQSAPTNRRRLRTSFFEEERKPKFGFGDFLRSALDGSQNAFADPAKVSEFTLDLIRNPQLNNLDGTITVQSLDDDNNNFLLTNFTATNESATLNFSNINQGSDPRQGTLTVNGTATVDGQTLQFNNIQADYNVGFSEQNDNVSAVLLVTDPDNPENSFFIEIPPTEIPGFDDDDGLQSTPANLTIGLPTDR